MIFHDLCDCRFIQSILWSGQHITIMTSMIGINRASNGSFNNFDISPSSYSVDGKEPGPLLNAETSEVHFRWASYDVFKGVHFKDITTCKNIYHNISHKCTIRWYNDSFNDNNFKDFLKYIICCFWMCLMVCVVVYLHRSTDYSITKTYYSVTKTYYFSTKDYSITKTYYSSTMKCYSSTNDYSTTKTKYSLTKPYDSSTNNYSITKTGYSKTKRDLNQTKTWTALTQVPVASSKKRGCWLNT